MNAKIFLADERGLQEGNQFRSYHTFNFGNYFNEFKVPFLNLYEVNDETLAGGHSVKMTIVENSYIILLPVVGAVHYKDSLGNENMISAGELQIIILPRNEEVELTNPYENDLVNFLQVRIQSCTNTIGSKPLSYSFNLVENKNRLLELDNYCSIGQFTGREEAVYKMKDRQHGLFVFVIEGAFEVQGRLLHPRDALALWDIEEPLEMEALSNEAIIFLVEVGNVI